MKESLLNEARNINDWLVDIRRDFHRYPELGMEETRTRGKIIEYLEELEIEYKRIANTGVLGIIRGKKEGKTVALRADMDALPIQDAKDRSYSSTILGKMHACGHDAHMTVLLGAARLLKEMEGDLSGNVKLLFQPAEETVGGAKPMIKEGAMENPKVDAVFGLHVAPNITVGEIGVKYGKMNASSDDIKIIIKGDSAHGAYPHEGIDAIMISAAVISSIQSVISRNTDPRNPAVVSLGTIKGGSQGNIIADNVEIVGTLRTLDSETREKTKERINKIVSKTAEAMDGRAEVIWEEGYDALINNDEMVDIVRFGAETLLGVDNVFQIRQASLGVEDFAFFAQAAPAAFYRLGCKSKGGPVRAAHHELFDIDENCLAIGVALQVNNALSFLGQGD